MAPRSSLRVSMALAMCGLVTTQRPPWLLWTLWFLTQPRPVASALWPSPGRQAGSQILVLGSLWKLLDLLCENLETRGAKKGITRDFMGKDFLNLFSDISQDFEEYVAH